MKIENIICIEPFSEIINFAQSKRLISELKDTWKKRNTSFQLVSQKDFNETFAPNGEYSVFVHPYYNRNHITEVQEFNAFIKKNLQK